MIFLFMYVYVSAGAYYIFGAKFFMSFFDHWFNRPAFIAEDDKFQIYFIIALFVVCFLGSLPSKIAALRYFTFITAIINLFLGLVLLFQIPDLRDYYKNDAPQAQYPTMIIDKNIFSSYCLSLFSSVNQFSVVNVLSEYQRPTERRVNKLILRSPFIPLLIYITVAVGGFFTCGDKCEEIIINRENRPGNKDYFMDVSKAALLVCLVVGIIIRNQSNKAGIFGIIDQFKKITEETETVVPSVVNYESVGAIENESATGKLSDELRKASSQVLNEQIDQTSFVKIFFIQLANSAVPAVTAILVKDDLINYVEAGSGFLAPVFMIIYPCLITIRLHQKGISPVSPSFYIFVWVFLVVATLGSYACLTVSFLAKFGVIA